MFLLFNMLETWKTVVCKIGNVYIIQKGAIYFEMSLTCFVTSDLTRASNILELLDENFDYWMLSKWNC